MNTPRSELGRNDLCWCGSGLKFKKCHLGRERQAAPPPHEVDAQQRAAFRRKLCLHPEAAKGTCSRKIVQAHTVRRRADLARIAREGHVYQVAADPDTLRRNRGVPTGVLVGVARASTFAGFCDSHDARLFAPVEVQPFEGTAEQCFLLFYRAWCRETYLKRAAAQAMPTFRALDRGRARSAQVALQRHVDLMVRGTREGVAENAFFKELLDTALLAGRYNAVSSAIVRFAGSLDVVASGACYPYWDLQGSTLQVYAEGKRLEPMSVTLLHAGGEGFAVFSWLAEFAKAPLLFVESLVRETRHGDAVVRFLFSALENVFARPEWWEELSEPNRADLLRRMREYMSPLAPTPPSFLKDDGRRYVNWRYIGTTVHAPQSALPNK